MGGFEGWWVDGKNGKGFHVAEHWMEVRQNPEKFGLTPGAVEAILKSAKGKFSMGDTSEEGQRGKLLIAAMKNGGWVRVRGHQGRYSIQLVGEAASKLRKVLPFLKKAGVGPYSQIFVSDLGSGFEQVYKEGMADIAKALRAGQIPDTGVGGEPTSTPAKGFPADTTDKQKRMIMRQRLGQATHISDPSPSDDKIEERRSLAKGLVKLLG